MLSAISLLPDIDLTLSSDHSGASLFAPKTCDDVASSDATGGVSLAALQLRALTSPSRHEVRKAVSSCNLMGMDNSELAADKNERCHHHRRNMTVADGAVAFGLQSSSHIDAYAYDHDYAALLNATIRFRKLSTATTFRKGSSNKGPQPVMELLSNDDDNDDPSEQRYFLRIPCRHTESRIMQATFRLAQESHVTIQQMLIDGSHDRFPDFALVVRCAAVHLVDEFCDNLHQLDFVLAAPTVLPVVSM